HPATRGPDAGPSGPTAGPIDGPPIPPPADELEHAETQDEPRTDAEDHDRKARVEALVRRAADAGLDLGRIPADPTPAWIVVTEGKLQVAIERKRTDRNGQRKHREAERRERIERLSSQADRLGVDLAIPPFPTEDWLARAELRIAAMVLTPGGVPPSDAGRAERFNRVYARATDAHVDLGEIPPDPDDAWLSRAETQVADAVATRQALLEDTPAPSPAVGASGHPAPGPAASALLVFEEGSIQETTWRVSDQPITIGRARSNTIQIRDDAGVSRKHCSIRVERGRFVLRDEGSTKGTMVDGELVRTAVLTGGETIRIGDTRYVFRVR
ncbi:MAG: FHA domain-containing protein, partial [Myxococcota bacterium]